MRKYHSAPGGGLRLLLASGDKTITAADTNHEVVLEIDPSGNAMVHLRTIDADSLKTLGGYVTGIFNGFEVVDPSPVA